MGFVSIYCVDAVTNEVHSIDMEAEDTVETLMVLIEVTLGIPLVEQRLTVPSGEVLDSAASITSFGVDGRYPIVTVGRRGAAATDRLEEPPVPASSSAAATENLTQGSAKEPVAGTESDVSARIRQLFAMGATAAPTHTPLLTEGNSSKVTSAPASSALVMAPPVGAEVVDGEALMFEQELQLQKEMYEKIQRSVVEENLQLALEYTPEIFGSVTLLYVQCEVNGVPLTALIDSGAQVSLMALDQAERCGIAKLIDRKRRSKFIGMGELESYGMVYVTQVNMGGLFMPFSVHVVDKTSPKFLIGLDQLRRHKMIINLDEMVLSIGDTKIKFLSEAEINW